MDALASQASLGRWYEMYVDSVYTVYQGLIYGPTHCSMCCPPYTEQQIESQTIHLKIKGSEQAHVGEEGFWHCAALCENMTTEREMEKHALLKSGFLQMIPLIIALQNHDV